MPIATVVGSGPNGLAAAIRLAQRGWEVTVYEGRPGAGGGVRTEALTLPGFHHDVCSAIHPLGHDSPFFRTLGLERYGLQWVYPPAAIAHPLDDGTAVLLSGSVEETASGLGPDEAAYRRIVGFLVRHWPALSAAFLGPLRIPPPHPLLLGAFGSLALWPAAWLARLGMRSPRTRALFAGAAAHSMLPLDSLFTSAFGLVMGVSGHTSGWPFPQGGAASLTRALVRCLEAMGGRVVTDTMVTSLDELPSSHAVLFDTSPAGLLSIAGSALPQGYRARLQRFRYGMAPFKIDYALDGPIPWAAADCARAATVHLGGTLEEMVASEREAAAGGLSDRPFCIVAQHTLFDPSRAPAGRHTAWVYCHVANGSTLDAQGAIEAQLERFAPGFRDRVLASRVMTPQQFAVYNPNYVGGDINGGSADWTQLFARPVRVRRPYSTPVRGVYLCSASTPPGGGVHGMCGYWAAQQVLADQPELDAWRR